MDLNHSNKYTTPVIKKDQPDDSYKFLPLPDPQGSYPYHLSLNNVLPGIDPDKICFHMVGDTGSLRNPDFQLLVAKAMAYQYGNDAEPDHPGFLYHLGDIVYNHGEAGQYPMQFFKTFEYYLGLIMAIAGNHDSDINPFAEKPYRSLDAFRAVFCDTVSRPVAFSGNSLRKSMTQPHIYWTLDTPLATIIGLHSNVPKFGVITVEQRQWFAQELHTANLARPGKAIIVCLHHAPYSADVNHGSQFADDRGTGKCV